MERKYYKAINFDLSINKLKQHYPGSNYRKAYEDLRRFFVAHGFSHRQGSGYLSNEKLTGADIFDLIDDLTQKLAWVGICIRKIDVTNVGQQYDLVDLLKPDMIDITDDLVIVESVQANR